MILTHNSGSHKPKSKSHLTLSVYVNPDVIYSVIPREDVKLRSSLNLTGTHLSQYTEGHNGGTRQ